MDAILQKAIDERARDILRSALADCKNDKQAVRLLSTLSELTKTHLSAYLDGKK